MASKMTEDELKEVKETFALMDEDGDGCITSKELGLVMQKMGLNPSEAELKEMIEEVDTNKNGTIEFNEFLVMMEGKMNEKPSEEEVMREAFKAFDKDGNGFITPDELKQVMTSLGEELSDRDINAMIKQADTNGDGKVNYAEFVKLLGS